MSNQITGIVHQVDDVKEYGDKGFRKRQVVLVQNRGKYDNYMPMVLIQDDCEMGDSLKVGQELTVEFSISGRRWVSPDGDVVFFQDLQIDDIINYEELAAESMSGETSSGEDVPF